MLSRRDIKRWLGARLAGTPRSYQDEDLETRRVPREVRNVNGLSTCCCVGNEGGWKEGQWLEGVLRGLLGGFRGKVEFNPLE